MNKPTQTLEELRGSSHLSYSAINTYLNICQLQYYYRYIEKLESECTPVALPFGSAFHTALSEQAQAAKEGRKLSAESLTEVFAECFKALCNSSARVVFKQDENPDTLIEQAGKMLEATLQEWRDYWNIDAVALPFKVELPGVDLPLIGEMDMLVSEYNPFDENPETRCIVDFKTAARMWPETKAGGDLQATVFSYAYEKLQQSRPLFRFDVITKTKNPALKRFYTSRNENDFLRLEALVQSMQRAVKAGVFLPNETSFACAGCPYASSCEKWHCSFGNSNKSLRKEVA